MSNIIGNTLYCITSSIFDGEFIIFPKGQTYSNITKYSNALSSTISDEENENKNIDDITPIGEIIDYKFILQYKCKLNNNNVDFGIDSITTYLKIKNNQTGKINYLEVADIFGQNYGNINAYAINGNYYDENNMSEDHGFSFSKMKLVIRYGNYAYMPKHGIFGYDFDMYVTLPIENKKYYEYTDKSYNDKVLNEWKYATTETEIFYTNLMFMENFYDSFGFDKKYKKKVMEVINKYLNEYKENQSKAINNIIEKFNQENMD